MPPTESQNKRATSIAIQETGKSILAFLQSHPDSVDVLNEAIMPFAYLTLLKPPPALDPRTSKRADCDSVLPVLPEVGSSRARALGSISSASSQSELEVLSPARHSSDNHPAQTHEAWLPHKMPSSWSNSSRNSDPEVMHDLHPRGIVENTTRQIDVIEPRPTQILTPADNANKQLAAREYDSGDRRSRISEKERENKRAKYQKRRNSLRRRQRPRSLTEHTESINQPSPTATSMEETASTLSLAPEVLTIGVHVDQSGGDYNQLVSAWMNDPEILRFAQTPALARHREPQQELLSYVDLIASIGTSDTVRSFAVGVTQLVHNARFSYEVPSAPKHLMNIEDADAMQCFWRAAYRSQVNASLVSFGVILHRRSLATLRYCYFKAIKSIKSTMQRKGLPGHTKNAIARSILLDTVFPGSDKMELKRMSDRLKNDVTRARNYCRLIEYYGSSGILGLLPRSLTDTRMRDFTDAEFDVFLSLVSRLRPDLEAERATAMGPGTFSRMCVWGRIIDMTQAGLPPLKDDHDFIQKDTRIILPGAEKMLDEISVSRSNASINNEIDQTVRHGQGRDAAQITAGTIATAISPHAYQEDYDTCGPSLALDSDRRVQEVSE